MSLSSILNDILDGATPTESGSGSNQPTDLSPNSVDQGAFEHLQGLSVVEAKVADLRKRSHARRMFTQALQSPTLSRSTAMELFTMLPLAGAREPILTQASSAHNRQQLLQAVSIPETTAADEDTRAEVRDLVARSAESARQLDSICRVYLQRFATQLDRLTLRAPLVVSQGKNVNLLECSIASVSTMDSYELQYKPYEGILDAKYRQITQSALYISMYEDSEVIGVKPPPSLHELTKQLTSVGAVVRDHCQTLIQFSEGAPIETDTDLEKALDALNWVKSHQSTFMAPGCLAELTLGVLEFLV